MELSAEAVKDLRETLELEIGVRNTNRMSDNDLEHIGCFFLETFKQGLKRRVSKI